MYLYTDNILNDKSAPHFCFLKNLKAHGLLNVRTQQFFFEGY